MELARPNSKPVTEPTEPAPLAGILAIDPARRIGFCFGRPGHRDLIFGSKVMGSRGGDFGAELFLPFFDWLEARITECRPRFVCYMEPMKLQHDTVVNLQRKFGLPAIVNLVAARRRQTDLPDLAVRYCSDQTVIRFFTGQARWGGTDNKKAATIATCKRLGHAVGDDNDAADAVALFHYVEAKLYPHEAAARGTVGPLFEAAAE
jgi:hypothetical protein